MSIDVLFLCPMQGNGGIASWTRHFLASFPNHEYQLYPIDIAPDKDFTLFRGLDKWIYGIKTFLRAFRNIRKIIRQNPQIRLMHTTTSGGNGALRDYYLGKYCKEKGMKMILHCRFGSIYELYESNHWQSYYFRQSLDLYDQIWVLDQHSADFLRSKTELREKVFLTPNSIEVPDTCNLQPKTFQRIGFIGNLLPTKGIFELTEAVASLPDNTRLVIVGQGLKPDVERIMSIAGDKLGKNIFFLGYLTNPEAVKLIESLDVICLPTYYPDEAFPISILEAMSRGKLVISCPRAAIPDMLTFTDGTPCGILIPEKSAQAIADAIRWCQEHHDEADLLCKKAYEKVKSSYSQNIVYKI